MSQVIYAKKAEPGKEYMTVKDGKAQHLVKCKEQKGDKTILVVHAKGYGYNTNPITVDGNYLLKTISSAVKAGGSSRGGEDMKKAAKLVKSSAPKAEPKAEASSNGRDKLPKIPLGKAAPRVEIEGVSYRLNYRSRLSERRARDCEAARKDSCRCRCGGVLHGKPHKPWFEAEEKAFSEKGYMTAKEIHALAKKFGTPGTHKHVKKAAKSAPKKAAKK